MRPNLEIGVATLLVIIGAMQAWTHAVAMSTLLVPGCLNGGFYLQVDVPVWQRVHCWGCYVAIAGLALLARAIYRRMKPRALAAAS